MPLSDAQLQALKTEVTTDPETLGYTGDDVADADLLNGGVTRQVQRETVSSREVVEAIIPGDWTGIADATRQHLLLALGLDQINVKAPNIRSLFQTAFQSTNTLTALQALQNRDGTRAEELFGVGVSVTPSEIANARRL